mmetsp:Transcript_16678/g.35213  ORF Transcript_16678/g.35213 Transcript_16678/m.35213 type:complete len:434 (+) Transcript_16678:473-1774(+)
MIMIFIFVIKFIIIIIQIIFATPRILLRISTIPIGTFHDKLGTRILLFAFVHVMILHPFLGRFDASESDVARGGSTVQRRPRTERGSMIEAPIEGIDVAPTSNDAILVFPSTNPLPHIARHVEQPKPVGLERFHRAGGTPSVLGFVFPRKGTLAPEVGVLFGNFYRCILAPGVEGSVLGTVMSRARGGLPFAFAGKTLADPFAVFGRVAVGDMGDGMIFAVFVGGSGTFGVAPVGLVDGYPIFRFRIHLGLLQLLGIGQERAQHKGPTVLFGLGFVIRRADELSIFFVRHGGLVDEEGIDAHDSRRDSASIEGMFLKPSKWFWPLRQIQLSPSFFVKNLLSRLPVRSVGHVVIGVRAVVFIVIQIGLFNFLVGFVESRAEDIFDSVIHMKSGPSTIIVHATDVHHAGIFFLVGIGMRFLVMILLSGDKGCGCQ